MYEKMIFSTSKEYDWQTYTEPTDEEKHQEVKEAVDKQLKNLAKAFMEIETLAKKKNCE